VRPLVVQNPAKVVCHLIGARCFLDQRASAAAMEVSFAVCDTLGLALEPSSLRVAHEDYGAPLHGRRMPLSWP
jgi:hypothetical protein